MQFDQTVRNVYRNFHPQVGKPETCVINLSRNSAAWAVFADLTMTRIRAGYFGAFVPLCFLSIAIVLAGCEKKAPPPPPPPSVQVIIVQPTNVPIVEEWVGTLDGFVNADIRAQVTGYLQTQAYKEGSVVKKGDLLFQIDPRPFQAVLDQAKAKLAQDQAQQHKTDLDVKRYTPLANEQAISQETLVDAQQADLVAQAQVKADDAAIETAQLNLDFTHITSPVDGVAGIALGQVGNLVSLGSGSLTTVSQIDPIKVYFNVSEPSYLEYWRTQVQRGNSDLELKLVLADGSVYPRPGKLSFANRQVSLDTGTLQVVALFPNPDMLLRPGGYGLVRAQTRVAQNVFLVPQRTVTELQGNYQVDVVDKDNKAHIKNVDVGEKVGSDWIIKSGISAGDSVIVEGLDKVRRDGTEVKPAPYVPPAHK